MWARNVCPCFVIPSIYPHKRIRNRGSVITWKTRHKSIRGYTDNFLQCRPNGGLQHSLYVAGNRSTLVCLPACPRASLLRHRWDPCRATAGVLRQCSLSLSLSQSASRHIPASAAGPSSWRPKKEWRHVTCSSDMWRLNPCLWTGHDGRTDGQTATWREAVDNATCTSSHWRARSSTDKLEFHGTSFPRSILVTASRGCHKDATRKAVPWNLS